jgi:hypothetical protein
MLTPSDQIKMQVQKVLDNAIAELRKKSNRLSYRTKPGFRNFFLKKKIRWIHDANGAAKRVPEIWENVTLLGETKLTISNAYMEGGTLYINFDISHDKYSLAKMSLAEAVTSLEDFFAAELRDYGVGKDFAKAIEMNKKIADIELRHIVNTQQTINENFGTW